jgi:hypothetical protein
MVALNINFNHGLIIKDLEKVIVNL